MMIEPFVFEIFKEPECIRKHREFRKEIRKAMIDYLKSEMLPKEYFENYKEWWEK